MTTTRSRRDAFTVSALACFATACAGDEPPYLPPLAPPPPSQCASVSSEPVRRLTAFELTRTLHELVGVEVDESLFPSSSGTAALDTDEEALGSSALLADGQLRAARAAADAVLARLEAGEGALVLGCAEADVTCPDTFIDDFGGRAYRRPVTSDEHARLRALHDEVAAGEGARVAYAALVQAMLMAPRFGFVVEDRTADGTLDDHSIAARMSLLLWATGPDEALTARAASGELADSTVRAEEAARMWSDPRARPAVVRFFRDVLDLERVRGASPEPTTYPAWSEGLRTEIAAETDRFVEVTLFDREGTLEALLTSRYVEAGPELSALYGIDSDAGELPPERAGILTRAAFLTSTAHGLQPSPVIRGVDVLERVLCIDLGSPPPDVSTDVATGVTRTNREAYAEHTSDPACQGCHIQIDPIGFALEGFDSMGGYRTTDNGQPVDATGVVLGTTVDGGAELSELLASTEQTDRCMVTQWVRRARGHLPTREEQCAVDELANHFIDSNGSLRELLVSLVASDLFIQ